MKTVKQLCALFTACIVFLSFPTFGQDTIPDPAGTVITQIPLTGPAIGRSTGKTFVYTNSNWPDYETPCTLWGVPDTLTEIINANNNLPPNQACSGMSDLVYNATLSSLGSGVAVYTGSTQYYHLNGTANYITSTVNVRLTLTTTTSTSAAIPMVHNNGHVFIPVNGNFQVNVKLTSWGPTNAMWLGSNLQNQWVPSVTLYDTLHTHPNRSICTSWEEGRFYSITVPGQSVSGSPYCVGDNITFGALGGDTYNWSGPNSFTSSSQTPSIPNITSANAGNYYVTITESTYGCPFIDTLNVVVNPLPSISASANTNPICYDDTLVLSGSGGVSYMWDNGVTDGVGFPATSSMIYSVTGTDANGCSNTSTIPIVVNPLPNVSITFSDDTICLGDSVTLSGLANFVNVWSHGVLDNIAFAPQASNTFTLTSTDGNGCSDSSTISIHVHNLPNVMANASPTLVCLGDQLTLSGSGAPNIIWANGIVDGQPFTPTTTNQYIVEGTDTNGCTNYDTIEVQVVPLPNPDLGPDTVICLNNDFSLNAGPGYNLYTWSTGDNSQSINLSATSVDTNDFWVVVTDTNGCAGGDTINVIYSICASIDEIDLARIVELYPNPVKDQLTLKFPESTTENLTLQILDVSGKLVEQYNKAPANGIIMLPVNHLKNGIYFIQIDSDELRGTLRIIKQ